MEAASSLHALKCAVQGMAFHGHGEFGGKPPARWLRMVTDTYFYYEGFVAVKASSVKTILDLKGKKIGWVA